MSCVLLLTRDWKTNILCWQQHYDGVEYIHFSKSFAQRNVETVRLSEIYLLVKHRIRQNWACEEHNGILRTGQKTKLRTDHIDLIISLGYKAFLWQNNLLNSFSRSIVLRTYQPEKGTLLQTILAEKLKLIWRDIYFQSLPENLASYFDLSFYKTKNWYEVSLRRCVIQAQTDDFENVLHAIKVNIRTSVFPFEGSWDSHIARLSLKDAHSTKTRIWSEMLCYVIWFCFRDTQRKVFILPNW